MPKNQTLDEFYSTFREEVLCASDTETSGWTTEDFLTNVMIEYLEEAGEVTDPVICPFRGYGLQMNAYAISEDCESVDIFVSMYSESDRPRSVSQADIDAAIKRAIQLYHKAINDLYTAFQKDNDTYEFAITLHQNKDNIKHVRICALTNGLVKPIALKNITIGDAEISFSLWDVDRLYRCVTSGKMRETIEIDFEEKFQTSIPCIENNTSKKYSVYLAIINGDLLAALYDEFRDRLLEKNVRSFLQIKGGVNKGIRDTLRDEPDMFLAYNNGISVTAESVEIVRDENGKPSIKRIRDMQIVNGGQTTASIFNAKNDRKIAADLSQVFVQMKISVIHSAADMDEIVPRISTFANTQNKIQVADFSANDPFHRRIEELFSVASPSSKATCYVDRYRCHPHSRYCISSLSPLCYRAGRCRYNPPFRHRGIPAAGAHGSCPPRSACATGRCPAHCRRYPAAADRDRWVHRIGPRKPAHPQEARRAPSSPCGNRQPVHPRFSLHSRCL